jgi:hypothetical protein
MNAPTPNPSVPNTSLTVSYLDVAQRWEISVTGLAGTTVLTERGDGLWAGKGAGGNIVEVLIDHETMPSAGLDLIGRAFGTHIAELIRQLHPEGDLNLVIARNLPTERSASPSSITPIGEPGVPVRVEVEGDLEGAGSGSESASASDRYLVPLVDHPALIEDPIWLTLHKGTLRIQLPDSARGQGLWVRISSAQSGSLLGLAEVRDASPPTAELTMNLEVRPEDLHIAITPTPLVPVGDRTDRQRQQHQHHHQQHQQLTDQTPMTKRRWVIGAALVLLAAALIGIGLIGIGLWSNNQSGGAAVTGDGLPGPMTATYSDGAILRAFIPDTLPEARPGDEIPLTITATTPELIGYGFDPATTPAGQEEQSARQACRSTINKPGFSNPGAQLSPRPITVRLRSVAASGAPLGSVIAASGNLTDPTGSDPTGSGQTFRFSSVPEACDTASFELNGAYLVPSIVERAPITLPIRLPVTLPAGLWAVSIDAPDLPVSVTGEILIRVRDR